jgi:predicted membrane GTPase involved in stress response
MTFKVNTSPFAGKEGKFVTSRNLKVREGMCHSPDDICTRIMEEMEAGHHSGITQGP